MLGYMARECIWFAALRLILLIIAAADGAGDFSGAMPRRRAPAANAAALLRHTPEPAQRSISRTIGDGDIRYITGAPAARALFRPRAARSAARDATRCHNFHARQGQLPRRDDDGSILLLLRAAIFDFIKRRRCRRRGHNAAMIAMAIWGEGKPVPC